jgi:hypothetical protein
MSRSKSLSNKEILDELFKKQLKNVTRNKLSYEDIKRLSKYIKSTIFDENCCSIWNGYITNIGNKSKGIYINFYYNSRKIALHRILYSNYIGDLTENEYLKFSCENKGRCCNIKHIQKFHYVKKNKNMGETKKKRRNKKRRIRQPTTLTLSFD